jgi:hypothetical protein
LSLGAAVAPRPESGDALVRAFGALEIFRHSEESGGFLGGRLLRPHDGGTFLVIAEWQSVWGANTPSHACKSAVPENEDASFGTPQGDQR